MVLAGIYLLASARVVFQASNSQHLDGLSGTQAKPRCVYVVR